jgi:type IV pilus secretin PilQ/predicted competence protein
MVNPFKTIGCATAALVAAWSLAQAQTSSPAPAAQANPAAVGQTTTTTATTAKPTDSSPVLLTQTSAVAAPSPAAAAQTTSTTTSTAASPAGTTTTVEPDNLTENGGVGVREFQGDDVGQVLRLLARQAKINMVVSEQVTGTVTMRLEDVTALQAIAIIVKAKNLFMDKIDNVYYIKTGAERTAEPTESDSYQFSYSRAKDVVPLIASQLASKDPPQVDERTNTIFYRETRGNIDNIRKLLVQIDKPTKQVMIEARLVEVTANPRQSYGINWGGVVGSSTNPKTFRYGGTTPEKDGTQSITFANGVPQLNDFVQGQGERPSVTGKSGNLNPITAFEHGFLNSFGGQFAIISAPQLSLTLRLLNEDADAEFLANPRVVTADNQQAKIEISRNQPVPQLNFNEQTATAVFGGFQDKKFGNTLLVRPSVNKDDFITLSVKPEISNKVGDAEFSFAAAIVRSPIIDTRSLESNVLIKSGNTLAIGGLLQDEQTKARSKVPVLGDIPLLGYFFQEKLNARTKRNLLVFVTPTIIDQRYGTGLEDQVSGLHHTGEEFADPNGWRNNAKGAVRLVPTAQRELAADYAKPGMPPPPEAATEVEFRSSAKDRDF